jgi:hypothetical protein
MEKWLLKQFGHKRNESEVGKCKTWLKWPWLIATNLSSTMGLEHDIVHISPPISQFIINGTQFN